MGSFFSSPAQLNVPLAEPLPALGASMDVTTSGFLAGGYLALELQYQYSRTMQGLGVVHLSETPAPDFLRFQTWGE